MKVSRSAIEVQDETENLTSATGEVVNIEIVAETGNGKNVQDHLEHDDCGRPKGLLTRRLKSVENKDQP